jgi:hemoglobin-like flavoprotein
LFLHRLFSKSAQAKTLFGFPADIDPYGDEVLRSKRFLMHSAYLIQMLDTALNILGPDIELLTEMMIELGYKHVRYGVTAEMFPIMGDALIETLQCLLSPELFTEQIKSSWIVVYGALSQDMLVAQKDTDKKKIKNR